MPAADAPDAAPPGQTLAITAEILFLANLLLAPVLAFAALAWLWHRHVAAAPALAANHLRQTFWVSLWGGSLLVAVSIAFVVLIGIDSGWTWTLVILYFTCVHSVLILCGMAGLARAMAGRRFRFPLIGPHEENGVG